MAHEHQGDRRQPAERRRSLTIFTLAILILASAPCQSAPDAVGPIRLGEQYRDIASAFGPGTHSPCKDVCVAGSSDVIVQYSDGHDLLYLDFIDLKHYGIALIQITQGAGAGSSIARLPRNAGNLKNWLYNGAHVFDQKAIDMLGQTQAGCKGGSMHYPAHIYPDKSGRLTFTLFEE